LSFFRSPNQSKTEAVALWIYVSLFLTGGYPIIINFAPSELSFSVGRNYSLLLAIPMSIPVFFYKGWKTGITEGRKVFSVVVGCVWIWSIAYLQLTHFMPWLNVRLVGVHHQELVRIRDRSVGGGVKRPEKHKFHVERMDGSDAEYALDVPKSVYESTPYASVLLVDGLRSDWGFLVTEIRKI
jgi:hypothetical protein